MDSSLVSSLDRDFAARRLSPARRILLSEGDAPGRVRFLSMPIELAEGAKQSWVTVTRTGTFTDPRWGKFEITPAMLAQMVKNFDQRVLGQEVFFDVAHKPSDGAAARVLKLTVDNGRLRALVEWTAFGIDAVRNRGFAYLSAEYHENWLDNEKGAEHGCVLMGAGLTTRPVIKHLDRVELSGDDLDDEDVRLAIHPHLLKHLEQPTMEKHLKALRAKLLAQGLTEAQIAGIVDAAKKQLEAAAADEAKCLALVDAVAAAGEAVAAQIKQLANPGAVTLQPTITIGGGVDEAVVKAAVQKLLDEQAAAAKAGADALAAKVKLLSDEVGASKALADDVKAEIVKELSPLVTAQLTDDQVKRLAEFAVRKASENNAAAQLALMGYRPPSGSVHITVDSGNAIKALQEQIDRRVGLAGMPDARRYERTGGVLLAQNKAFAERVLAQFDAERGAQLAAEHKLLSGGISSTSDTSVPVAFERTVLREALYNLQGLSLVDSGTVPFANVITVPYSYRDTTAAGVSKTRVYERQGIPRAGIVQTSEEARPLPQKLSMHIANEMRYLLAGSPIDFDPLAENTRNITRIISEDTDKAIQNEILQAADEAGVAAGNDTLTAQVNGTNKIFVLTQFPVVRPRRGFDLKGNQVGNTVNPITVTLNSVARTEYVSGTTLAAGLYWVMDYNLGEIRFVNELGVLQTPTSAWPLTIQYSYTTNVAKHDLDVGVSPDTIAAVYDRLLTKIGARKVVIENDRYYMANMLLMSGAIDNALGQATTFQANSSRPGTGLNADGSVGVVKGIPSFNTRAPGLDMADTRILVGERGQTRFRMAKPLQFTELSEARDSNGLLIGAKEGYADQFIVVHTPTQVKNSKTSLVLYSAGARVARAS